MTTPSSSHQAARRVLLEQIAAITTMQPGTLAEEWREGPDPHGEGAVLRGPYFKYQVWKDGRNVSRRVPAAEAAQLREDIDSAKRFAQLTGELARINIEHTLALRAAQACAAEGDAEGGESKKNSSRRQARKSSPKQRPSSQRPKQP